MRVRIGDTIQVELPQTFDDESVVSRVVNITITPELVADAQPRDVWMVSAEARARRQLYQDIWCLLSIR